jgi:protein involved in polysaccharide export with SLBB domain
MRGEKLSSLIARAGGITREAYAPGTVFMRASARRQEAAQFKTAAQQLEQSLARALSNEDKKPNSEQVDMARQLANELRNAPAVGRITVQADPDVLRLRPDEDVLLEAGDEIIIPPRRQTVAVMGEVHAPVNAQFIAGKDAGQYLKEAGGFTRFADESHAFVIMPNGAARPLRVSAWNHEDTSIVPGSGIVVPRDPDNYDTLQLVSGIGNILSQLAVSTAAIASINDNND